MSDRQILEDAIAFIESLAVVPLLMTDDIEMRLEDVQEHARIEAASLRKRLADRSTRPAEPAPEVEVGDGEIVAWPHHLNEAMDALTSALQWMKNIRDGVPCGIPLLREAISNTEAMLAHVYEAIDAEPPLVRLSTLEAERARAQSRENRLREALQPLAALGGHLHERDHAAGLTYRAAFWDCPSDLVIYHDRMGAAITVGDIRAVRQTMEDTRQNAPLKLEENGADDLTAAFMAGFGRGKDAAKAEADELRRERDEARKEADRLSDEIADLNQTPWPAWAEEVLKVIRKRSGYDGYDDASEGVNLPDELDECMSELEREADALAQAARADRETDQHKATAEHYRKQADELRASLSRALQDRDEAVRVAEALTYALTPSADTKALMIAEFFEEIEVPNPEYQGESDDPEDDDDKPEFVAHRVPIQWGTIKHMLATLREFARLRADRPATGEGNADEART